MEIVTSYDKNIKHIKAALNFQKRTAKKNKASLKDSLNFRDIMNTIKVHKNDLIVSGIKVESLNGHYDLKGSIKEAKTLKAKRRIARKFFKKNPELLI